MAVSSAQIINLVQGQRQAHEKVNLTLRIRRALVSRDDSVGPQYTGTILPAPFNRTSLAIRTMTSYPTEVTQHYASRLSANAPRIEVTPITLKDTVSVTVDKQAGMQERLDSALWEEMGGREQQWAWGWGASLGGAAYYLCLPRDADFGLPSRIQLDQSDDLYRLMKQQGKLSSYVAARDGKMIYAEHGDVWAGRRKEAAKQRAVDGRSLFTLKAYPRDMVCRERDRDGLKWAAIVEELPLNRCGPGSDIGTLWAKAQGKPQDDWGMFGVFVHDGKITGGISDGGPLDTKWRNATDVITLIRFFDRVEQVIMIAPRGSVYGGDEVYRGAHGCNIGGVPQVPIEEVPFFRTDVDVPGQEFSTPVDRVLAYSTLINQIETLRSNATAFNLLPRWVVEKKDGTILRDLDGEPKIINGEMVPGLDPQEASTVDGTLRQLMIATADSDELLKLYLEQVADAMPSPVTSGISGSSAPAYQVQQLIQQAQEILRQPADNHCKAVTRILQKCHGWLRPLDTPVYFSSAPGHRKNRRSVRGLIEFTPSDLTDAISVTQELDTPSERTIAMQIGMEQLQAGLITYEEYFRDYARVQDERQAVIDMYVQQVVNHVMGNVPAPPESVIQFVADSVRGQLTYELLATSPNFALASARQMALRASAPAATGLQPNAGAGNVANAAGARVPGMGLAPTLDQQLGSNVPGGQSAPAPAGVA